MASNGPPLRSLFRPFPSPPPYPRLPRKWDLTEARKWCENLLRVLDQQTAPLAVVVVPGITSTYTIQTTTGDVVALADASGGAFTVTLPPAANMVNHYVTVKNIGAANNVTLQGNGAETIMRVPPATNTQTINSGSAFRVISDGTGWYVV